MKNQKFDGLRHGWRLSEVEVTGMLGTSFSQCWEDLCREIVVPRRDDQESAVTEQTNYSFLASLGMTDTNNQSETCSYVRTEILT